MLAFAEGKPQRLIAHAGQELRVSQLVVSDLAHGDDAVVAVRGKRSELITARRVGTREPHVPGQKVRPALRIVRRVGFVGYAIWIAIGMAAIAAIRVYLGTG